MSARRHLKFYLKVFRTFFAKTGNRRCFDLLSLSGQIRNWVMVGYYIVRYSIHYSLNALLGHLPSREIVGTEISILGRIIRKTFK